MRVDDGFSSGFEGLSRWFGSPGRWAGLTVLAAVLATASIVVQGAPAAAVPAEPAARTGPDVSGPAVASDPVSAMVQARAQDRPIEDVSQRTVDSSTFALPDGTWASGVGSGPVWVPRMDRTGGDGSSPEDWAKVDLTLAVGTDGLVRPRAQIANLVLSGGESSPEAAAGQSHTVVAAVTDPATGVVTTSGWDGDLPTPRLEGRRAVYADVLPGVDLVIEATSTGFEEFFVLADAEAAEALAETRLSLAADGAQVRPGRDETLSVTKGDDEVAATSGVPLMWDAQVDAARPFPLTVPRPAEPAEASALSAMPDWDEPRTTPAEPRGDAAPPGGEGDAASSPTRWRPPSP